jgi:Asp-tRNA(Asn)/Glu-tRNA(Gln) amidotransferase A subunit family amidase
MKRILMKRRYVLGLVVAFFLLILFWKIFFPKDPADLTRDLNNLLTVLRDNRVTDYRDQDWCRHLETTEQLYADPPTDPSVACLANSRPFLPFDEKTKVLFENVKVATETAGLDIVEINVEFGKAGGVQYAEVAERQLLGRDAYMYQPDDVPPEFPKGRVTRVGKDWFHYQGD